MGQREGVDMGALVAYSRVLMGCLFLAWVFGKILWIAPGMGDYQWATEE